MELGDFVRYPPVGAEPGLLLHSRIGVYAGPFLVARQGGYVRTFGHRIFIRTTRGVTEYLTESSEIVKLCTPRNPRALRLLLAIAKLPDPTEHVPIYRFLRDHEPEDHHILEWHELWEKAACPTT